ncbi:MAG: hypothetical protein P0Y62_07535 [Candidatus Chryseobacterium colombiense]|nr:hypothetical protein [Chryseobacterium sp.]WEK71405.1 MAG: hypothetical protein P0Y62_07535 [Chryseobacterium sp.]
MSIVTKFALATDESIDMLLKLVHELVIEKYSQVLNSQQLQEYIEKYYSPKYFVSEMNSMSNQSLMVYADNVAVGYARVTSRGKVPELLNDKRVVRIADFSILQSFMKPDVQESLWQKCFSVCKYVDAIWINEYQKNPILEFFESKGFLSKAGTFELDEIPLPSVCMIYQNSLK